MSAHDPLKADVPNKVAIALAAYLAMREHRKDKPVSFQWPKRWSDPAYMGDGPWGA